MPFMEVLYLRNVFCATSVHHLGYYCTVDAQMVHSKYRVNSFLNTPCAYWDEDWFSILCLLIILNNYL